MPSSRSWTDAITNEASLASPELVANLRDLVEDQGKPPITVAPALLHEATHHWCFHSPVVTALSVMQLRARLSTYRTYAMHERPFIPRAAITDLGVSNFALGLLRPLTEGIALFAEFDATPGASEVLSVPMNLVLTVFNAPEVSYDRIGLIDEPPRSDAQRAIRRVSHRATAFLYQIRPTPLMRRRKEHLLLQPFLGGEEQYLAGYISVKNLWRGAKQRDPRFVDSDLFLAFLRYYIYCDRALVDLVLSETRDPAGEGLLQRIVDHIQSRIKQIFDGDLKELLTQFERTTLKVARTGRDRIAVEEEKIHGPSRGITLLMGILDELGNATVDIPDEFDYGGEQMVRFIHGAILERRLLFRVGTLPVRVRVDGERVKAAVGDETIVVAPTIAKSVLPGSGEGRAEVWISMAPVARICGIFRGGELVGMWSRPQLSSREMRQLTRRVALSRPFELDPEPQTSEAREYIQRVRNAAAAECLYALPRVRNQFYGTLATEYVSDRVLGDVQTLMAEDGFWKIVGESTEAVQALALLGLCCSPLLLRPSAARVFAEQGLDLNSLAPKLAAIGDRYEVFTVTDRSTHVWSSI